MGASSGAHIERQPVVRQCGAFAFRELMGADQSAQTLKPKTIYSGGKFGGGTRRCDAAS